MDELPEFSREALEVLRQPIEDGCISVSRVHGTATYPCRFMLVAAMNPCKCGYYGSGVRECSCTPSAIERYRQRISGPLLDLSLIHIFNGAPGLLSRIYRNNLWFSGRTMCAPSGRAAVL